MKVTWYGTASIGLTDGETKLLIDPYVRRNKKLDNTPLGAYTGADAILVTHGHLDHIQDIPKLTKADTKVPVYCTATPCKTLQKYGVAPERIREISCGEQFSIGNFNIKVHHGHHVTFNAAYVAKVFARCTVMFPKTFQFEYYNIRMPENDEIVIYEIENGGKTVLVMGSYGIDEKETYPENADLFILPYGGSTAIPEMAMPFIEKIHPKKILVDHFDDAFPPLTRRMDVEAFGQFLFERDPDLSYVIPKERTPIEI